jgi:LmbE family N-acetylglucosaminyl deacetylase
MYSLDLSSNYGSPLRILCLGAHSDDIEIGCGGTILSLAQRYPNSVLYWAVFSAIGSRAEEAKRAASLFAGTACSKELRLKTFRDGFMPFDGAEVKMAMEELKEASPDVVFTHNRRDAHQDHRFLAELTWNTFRDHLILEYEIPKYDGDLGQPGIFVPLEIETCNRKVSYIMDTFQSQRNKNWFRPETLLALMRLRGMECNSPSGYAEAFYGRKLMLRTSSGNPGAE